VLLHEGHGLSFYTRGTQTSVQSSVGRTIALDKAIAKAILQRLGLPTARGFLASSEDDLQNLALLDGPYVVKPVDGKQGVGVHVGLRDEAEVRARFLDRLGPVIVEELLQGEEYRVFCVAYEVVAVAQRKPAFVVGDGVQSVRDLIAAKNRHVWRDEGHIGNLTKIEIDADVSQTLRSIGRTVDDVPPAGEEVRLRRAANLSLGGEAVDVTDQLSGENRALLSRIARAVDLDVVGIDLLCQSLQEPIEAQPRAGVVEVNASPGLRMHHFPMGGTPRNIAGLVLAHVVQKLGGLRAPTEDGER
jgi:cyanophycin synthetase